MQGTIIKGIAGFYYVQVEDKIIECKAKGKFKYKELTPMVGDKVEIEVKNGKGRIDNIFERTSMLIRPYVANVTQAFIVFSVKTPELNEELLHRFIVFCDYNHLKIIVCFNKIDLMEKENIEILNNVQSAGYDVLFLRAKEGFGIDALSENVKDNLSVLCGPSGVGKSTILNKLIGDQIMETGELSSKVQRGKNTTRHSQLSRLGNGFIIDTPGFSSIDLSAIKKEELMNCFPEFLPYLNQCKFGSCMHYKEPGCKVKEAVELGKITNFRYNLYVKLLEEIMSGRPKYD